MAGNETQTPTLNDDAQDQIQNIRNVFSIVAPIILAVGILGNVLSLAVFTRSDMKVRIPFITTIMIFCVKRVLYVYLWWLSLSNFCALISVVPVVADLSYNDGKGIGNYIAVLYQVVQSLTLPFNITIYRLTL